MREKSFKWGVTFPRVLVVACALCLMAQPVSAGDLTVRFSSGRVTIVADRVPLRQILEKWASIGGTEIVNLDSLSAELITVDLQNVPERQALGTLLASAPGFVAVSRSVASTGESAFGRLLVQAATTAGVTMGRPLPPDTRPAADDEAERWLTAQTTLGTPNVLQPGELIPPARPGDPVRRGPPSYRPGSTGPAGYRGPAVSEPPVPIRPPGQPD